MDLHFARVAAALFATSTTNSRTVSKSTSLAWRFRSTCFPMLHETSGKEEASAFADGFLEMTRQRQQQSEGAATRRGEARPDALDPVIEAAPTA